MEKENQILDKLAEISTKLDNQNLLSKPIINFNEACKYLDVSASHLYKLTSKKGIPHFCPQGKKIYFKRDELDDWLQTNRRVTIQDTIGRADNFRITQATQSRKSNI